MTYHILKPLIVALIITAPIPQTANAVGLLSFPSLQWPDEGPFSGRKSTKTPSQDNPSKGAK
jgi:hypothetical protein